MVFVTSTLTRFRGKFFKLWRAPILSLGTSGLNYLTLYLVVKTMFTSPATAFKTLLTRYYVMSDTVITSVSNIFIFNCLFSFSWWYFCIYFSMSNISCNRVFFVFPGKVVLFPPLDWLFQRYFSLQYVFCVTDLQLQGSEWVNQSS